MELKDLTEAQWGEIAFRFIFDMHPFPFVAQIMAIDRARSEEFGAAIQRFGGIVPLVESLVADDTLPAEYLEALANHATAAADEAELQHRVAAAHRALAGVEFVTSNPHMEWSQL